MYVFSMLGNLIIIGVVHVAPRLHTPMYFFLSNLSTQDVAYVSTILPKLLVIEITGETCISFLECFTQMFVFMGSAATDTRGVCTILALISWMAGFFNALLYVFLISHLSFCDSKSIQHFFCDMKALIRLSCSDVTHMNNMMLTEVCVIGILLFAMILTSYAFIISTILKIKTSASRMKIFSSCSSHLTVVFLFCGTSMTIYLKPDSESSKELDMVLSLLYVAVVPACNPLVYTLRNQEVLSALKIKKNIFN
ncbi:hypothetical protein GDO81_028277 [Engystomops pustulosus]|uniref:G-protein coupled receptors family 1 profile domain-containing protein n=1 Tax=Engystomops pustulosus TaxID=76066 RepID=A0AAV6YIV0_ENGPU|nr:hypothetical protein GDO81_028277 [Engystomops pustulosus]